MLSFLQIFFFYFAFKEERHLYPYLIFVLFTGQYFLLWMNVIRQDIAACMFLFSIVYIEKQKFWKYLLWCLIGSLFHKTALLLIFLYPILKNGKDYFKSVSNQFFILFLFVIIYFTSFNVDTLIQPLIYFFTELMHYNHVYIDSAIAKMSTDKTTGLGFILFTLLDVIFILNSNKLKEYYNTKRFTIIYNIYYFGAILQVLFANSYILARPFRYFRYFKLIMGAYLLYYLIKHGKPSNNLVYFIIIVSIYLLLFGAIFYTGDINKYTYLFFWQK